MNNHLAVDFDHGLAMAWINLVAAVRAQSDPGNIKRRLINGLMAGSGWARFHPADEDVAVVRGLPSGGTDLLHLAGGARTKRGWVFRWRATPTTACVFSRLRSRLHCSDEMRMRHSAKREIQTTIYA